MHKILYAINHRQTEDAITQRISKEYLAVGAVTYKEAVLEQLRTTGADTLLIRESLPGSTPLERLVKRIRVEFPGIRIIIICNERLKQDPFLQELVNLAVYDIINSNKPTLSDICSYVLTPRTYRDAAQYGIGQPTVPTVETSSPAPPVPAADEAPKGKSWFNDIVKGFASLRRAAQPVQGSRTETETAVPAAPASDQSMPQVDFDLLRATIKEAETRNAQKDLDKLISVAVEKQTAELKEENSSLKQRLTEVESHAAEAKAYIASAETELNEIRSERDRLRATLDEERVRTQALIDMYESQLRDFQNLSDTPQWYSEQSSLWEEQKANLTAQLNDKTKEAEEARFKVEALVHQLQEGKTYIAQLETKLQRAGDMQLSERGADELIAKLRAEATEAKVRVAQLEKELENQRSEPSNTGGGGPDYAYPVVDVPLLPDDAVYIPASGASQTILMVGAKHGVGNTTVALNLAASLAGRGHKTLLVELNGRFPMMNAYFEFTHIAHGFEECIDAISDGRLEDVSKAIIRPHGLSPSQSKLARTYKKLPRGLHFLLFSNESLVKRSYEGNPHLTEASLYTLLSYLVRRQQYSHIILDVQCDDRRLLSCLINSGYQIDKLCVTLSQDPHAVVSAGSLITTLSRAHASSLIVGGEFIVNRFNSSIPVHLPKIEKLLHLRPGQISKVNEDSAGYFAAAHAAMPYLQNNGSFRMDYESLREKIIPHG